MSNQSIAARFIEMMNPYFSFSALMSGILTSVSTTVSPIATLSLGWCTKLSGGYGLNLGLQSNDVSRGNNLLILFRSLGHPPDRS